jgi:hypothetical protein
MNFSHVSLTQNGTVVTGKYHDWGVTYGSPEQAGTLSGKVSGQSLTAGFQNNAGDLTGTVTWLLSNGQLQGTYNYGGATSYPWCGVAAGKGTPLPTGCGWSDAFTTASPPPLVLTQVADEVTGIAVYGPVAGVVSDYRVNGTSLCTWGGCAPNSQWRISYQMSRDGTQFSGNYSPEWNGAGYYNSACGGRLSTGTPPPATCMGGGGIYDGTWFTNVGVLTLTQPVAPASGFPSASVTGIWFPWGPNPVEYVIDGGTATPESGTLYSALPGQTTLSWVDSSPMGGAVVAPSDPMGVTLNGQTTNGSLVCGVNYGTDPFNAAPYGKVDAGTDRFHWNTDPIGSLFPGCGLTGNQWTLWPPLPGGSGSPTGQVVERRDTITGTTDLAGLNSVAGTVVFRSLDGGVGPWTVVTGSWTDSSTADGGTFTWYPDSQDQSFTGDFTIGPVADGGVSAWCGSSLGAEPSPCLQ